MIDRLIVKAFKSLDDVEVELGRVNVFIGANGSGKTNLLEALGMFGAAASGRVDDESLLRRGVRPGVPALYLSSFRGQRARDAVCLEAHSADVSYFVELTNLIEDPRPAWHYETEKLTNGDVTFHYSENDLQTPNGSIEPALRRAASLTWDGDWTDHDADDPLQPQKRLLAALRYFGIYTPTTGALRGLTPDPQQRGPVGLSGGRLPEAVRELRELGEREDRFGEICADLLELIDWAADYGTRSVETVPLSRSVPSTRQVLFFRDRFMADGRNELTGYDASEGVLYLLFAAVLAVHPQAPQLLAIENVDHALNPRLARALMEKVCSWVLEGPEDKQILLTCHNALVLDGLPLQNDEVRLFAVDRSRKGRTVIQRVKVDEAMLEKAREGWTLSRLWVMGHLGGVPDV